MIYANYSVFLRYFDLCFRGCSYMITANFRRKNTQIPRYGITNRGIKIRYTQIGHI